MSISIRQLCMICCFWFAGRTLLQCTWSTKILCFLKLIKFYIQQFIFCGNIQEQFHA